MMMMQIRKVMILLGFENGLERKPKHGELQK